VSGEFVGGMTVIGSEAWENARSEMRIVSDRMVEFGEFDRVM
jgi:hypothetical protein